MPHASRKIKRVVSIRVCTLPSAARQSDELGGSPLPAATVLQHSSCRWGIFFKRRGNEQQQSVRDHETLKSFHGSLPISVTRSLLFNPGDRSQTEPASRGCSYQSTAAIRLWAELRDPHASLSSISDRLHTGDCARAGGPAGDRGRHEISLTRSLESRPSGAEAG